MRATSCIRPLPLLALGAAHFAVDAACAALVFGLVWDRAASDNYLLLMIGYNTLAFAMQPLFALFVDKIKRPITVAASGVIVTGAGIVFSHINPVFAICLAGIGNALFHLGGGIVALNMDPGQASAPGLFVAPGALGVAIGSLFGGAGSVPVLPCLALLMITGAAVFSVKVQNPAPLPKPGLLTVRMPVLIATLLLAAIAIRSLVGFGAGIPWSGHHQVLFLIACAAFGGKALGGIIADRYGWLRTSVTVLLLSTPLLAFGSIHPAMNIAGMLLFQMVMPVTLAGMFRLFPHRPAFAFGLTCLALITGAAPFFTEAKYALGSAQVQGLLGLAGTAMLYAALRLLAAEKPRIPEEIPRPTGIQALPERSFV